MYPKYFIADPNFYDFGYWKVLSPNLRDVEYFDKNTHLISVHTSETTFYNGGFKQIGIHELVLMRDSLGEFKELN